MGSFPIPLLESLNAEHSDASKNQYSSLQDSFLGFHSDSNDNIWNLSNWSNISQPNGFDFLTVYDYSDEAYSSTTGPKQVVPLDGRL